MHSLLCHFFYSRGAPSYPVYACEKFFSVGGLLKDSYRDFSLKTEELNM